MIDQAESAKQRGLAHARFATDKHETANLTGLLQPLPERGQERSPLQQIGLHGPAHAYYVLLGPGMPLQASGACHSSGTVGWTRKLGWGARNRT